MGYFIRMPRPTEAKQFRADNAMEIVTWLTDKGHHVGIAADRDGKAQTLFFNPGRTGGRTVPLDHWVVFDPDTYPMLRVMDDEIFRSQYAPT
jgi:hypothetical protein